MRMSLITSYRLNAVACLDAVERLMVRTVLFWLHLAAGVFAGAVILLMSATGVALTVTQNGEAVTASVGGVSGAALDLVLASHEFVGTIDGEHMDLRITGERAASMGACAYTLNADVAADIDGDTLTGTITYRPQTNGASDCNYLNTCSNVQAFNGTRPPR